MDTQDNNITYMHWICADKEVELDTIKLQHLANFMKYQISRLDVDTVGTFLFI